MIYACCAFELYKLAIISSVSKHIRMEKLKQKVAALQDNIEKSKSEIEKVSSDVNSKEEAIVMLQETIEDLNSKISTIDTDLETSEEELSCLKVSRKKLADDEEEQDRNLRKLQLSTTQSKAGAFGLQEKIDSHVNELADLQTDIEEKKANIDTLEQDLDIAEQNNNSYKEQLVRMETELSEATNIRQSIASTHATTSGAGGSLRNQVEQRNESLKKRKGQLEEISQKVEVLLQSRDTLESDIEEAHAKLENIKTESAQIIEDLDTL